MGTFFAKRFVDFLRVKNFSCPVIAHTRPDSLAVVAPGKNRRRASNTSELRRRLYFVRLDARIVFAHDHFDESNFNVSRAVLSLRGGGAGGAVPPPNDCLCSPISVYSEYVSEHHVRKKQQATTEKEIVTLNIILF